MGAKPGGRVGVRLASVGMGGGGPRGGGVAAGPAYGLVIYEVSDVIEGIGSRNPDLLVFRLPPPPSLQFFGDRRDRPLDGDDRVSPERVLMQLIGG